MTAVGMAKIRHGVDKMQRHIEWVDGLMQKNPEMNETDDESNIDAYNEMDDTYGK